MKKYFSLFLALVFFVALFGCSSEEADEPTRPYIDRPEDFLNPPESLPPPSIIPGVPGAAADDPYQDAEEPSPSAAETSPAPVETPPLPSMVYYPPVMTTLPPVEPHSDYILHEITMPFSDAEKTVANRFIYKITFSLSLCLPNSWTIREAAAMKEEGLETFQPVDGIYSVLCILDTNQVPVGAIGYCDSGGHGTFGTISLAKHSFMTQPWGPMNWGPATVLYDDGNFLLMTTEVKHDHSANENLPCTYTRGILAQDEEIGAVVAIELDYNALHEGELRYIAERIRMKPLTDGD